MYGLLLLSSVLGLSLLFGTGAFAETKGGGAAGTSDTQAHVPKKVQRSTPSGGFGESIPEGSGPGERGDALTSSETRGGESAAMIDAEAHVPEKVQRSTPSGGFGESIPEGSGPGERIDATTGSKHKKP